MSRVYEGFLNEIEEVLNNLAEQAKDGGFRSAKLPHYIDYTIGISTSPKSACCITTDVQLWYKGSATLGHTYKFDWVNNGITEDLVDWVAERIIDDQNGIIHCSCCDKKIKTEEIAGSYFAGRYCSDCWERKYKKKAYEETYE